MSAIQRLIKISLLNATSYNASNWGVLNGIIRLKTGDATFTAGQSPDGFDSTYWINNIEEIGAIDEVADFMQGSGLDTYLGASFSILNATQSIGSMLDDFETNEVYLEGANVEIYDNDGATSKLIFSGKVRDLEDNRSSLTIICCSKLELSNYQLPEIILGDVENYPVNAEIETNYYKIINESDYTAAIISRVKENYQAKIYRTVSIPSPSGKLLIDSSGKGGVIRSIDLISNVCELCDSSSGEFSVLSDGSGDVVTISNSEYTYSIGSGEFESLNVGNLSPHNFSSSGTKYTYSCAENRPDGKTVSIHKPISVITKAVSLNDASGVTASYYNPIGTDIYSDTFTDLKLNNLGTNYVLLSVAGPKASTFVNLNFSIKFDDDFDFSGKKLRWEVIKDEDVVSIGNTPFAYCTPILLDDSTINGFAGDPSANEDNARLTNPIRFNGNSLEKYSNTNPYLMNIDKAYSGDVFIWDELQTGYNSNLFEAPFEYKKTGGTVNGKIYYDRGEFDHKIRLSDVPTIFDVGDKIACWPNGNTATIVYKSLEVGFSYLAIRSDSPTYTFDVGQEVLLFPDLESTGITITETDYYDLGSRFLYWSIVDGEWSLSTNITDTGESRYFKYVDDPMVSNIPQSTFSFQKSDESYTLTFSKYTADPALISKNIDSTDDLAVYHRSVLNNDNLNYTIKSIEPKFLKENGMIDISIAFEISSLGAGSVIFKVCNFYLEDLQDASQTTADIIGESWDFGAEYGYSPKFSLPIFEYLLINYGRYNTSLFDSEINPSAIDDMGYNYVSNNGTLIDELDDFISQSPYRIFQSANGTLKPFDWKLLSGLETYSISKAFDEDEINQIEVSESDLSLVKNNDRIEYGYNYSTGEYEKYLQLILSSNSWNLSLCVDTNDSAILNSSSLVSKLQIMWEVAKESINLTGTTSGDTIRLKNFKPSSYGENRVVNFLNNRINSFAFRHKLYSFGVSNAIMFGCSFNVGDIISVNSLEKTGNVAKSGIVNSISIIGQNVNIQMIGFSEGLSVGYIDQSDPYSGNYIDQSAPYSGDYIDEAV